MTTLMRNGRDRRLGTPAYGPREARTRAIGWDPIRELQQGHRPLGLHRDGESLYAKTGRIHGCTRTLRKKVRFALATRAPSIHGPSRRSWHGCDFVAIGLYRI